MKKIAVSLLALSISGVAGSVHAGTADGAKRAVRGTVACGGNHVVRKANDEFQLANFILRNYDPVNTINVDRIRFFDSTGAVMRDYPGTALPTFFNGILGPGDNTLESNQTAQLRSQDIFGLTGLPRSQRPIQMVVDWSAHHRTLLMETSLVRLSRERVVSSAGVVSVGKERGRHQYDCRTIRTRKR